MLAFRRLNVQALGERFSNAALPGKDCNMQYVWDPSGKKLPDGFSDRAAIACIQYEWRMQNAKKSEEVPGISAGSRHGDVRGGGLVAFPCSGKYNGL